jgi:hypothetical protein
MDKYGTIIFSLIPNRPMLEYVAIPPTLYSKVAMLRKLALKSIAHVFSLPVKPAKFAKRRPAGSVARK